MTASNSTVHPLVAQALERHDIAAEVLECKPEWADTAEFCANYSIAPEDACNAIVVVVKTTPKRYVACLARADTKLDVNHKLAAITGTKKMSFASADETAELTSMLIGGVTVVGLPEGMELLIDERVLERERIVVGGGTRSTKLLLQPAELLKLPSSRPADIAVLRTPQA
jgi:prolyl-tRNA editing enzyme YbaK/EbsC (Cys-tRNA(Pro) deacylase)